MKQLDKPISVELNAIVIYEEELRDLFALLNEHCAGIKLTANKVFQFDDVDELIQKFSPHRIKELTISSAKPYINIELHTLWARVYVESSTPAMVGLSHQCMTILKRHSLVYGILCSYKFFWTIVLVEAVFGSILKGEWSPFLKWVYYPYIFWILFVRMTRHSLIYARKSDSIDSFLIRNKDKLIVDAIIGIVGIVIGIILKSYFLK